MLSLNNKKVYDFYTEHPTINFEKMNILFVNILNKLFTEVSPNMDSQFAITIIEQMKNLNGNIESLNNNNANNFALKFLDFKKEYITDLKQLLNNNNSENIKPLLIEYNSILQDKTKILLNDIIPNLSNEINTSLKDLDKSFIELKSINMDNKCINEKVNEVLKKFENSSSKGNMSEMAMFNILKGMYSEKLLKIVNTTKESGDILLVRNNKPIIMFENKDYKHTVNQLEVDKFIRDIGIQNYSGVFISQNSDIANKNTFEINFYGNNIGIYISKLNYNSEIIQIAIDIIDSIKSKFKDNFDSNNSENELTLDREQLDILNNQFNTFIYQKKTHIKTIKDFYKKLLSEAEELNISIINNIIMQIYGTNEIIEHKCDRLDCDFIGKNPGSLASHIKAHIRRGE